MEKIENKNNEKIYDELYQKAKEYCQFLENFRLDGFVVDKSMPPFSHKQLYEIFKIKSPHDKTKAIIKIADKLARIVNGHFGTNDALHFLDMARKSALAKEQYRHNFFYHKTCIEKIKSCEARILKKKEKEEKRKEASHVPEHL